MDISNDIEFIELLKHCTVGTAEAAEYLKKSPSMVRRYARSKREVRLRNLGADGSFRFSLYDLKVMRDHQLKKHSL